MPTDSTRSYILSEVTLCATETIKNQNLKTRLLDKVENRKNTNYLTPIIYIGPALLMYSLFFLWPAFQLVRLSFLDWDGLSQKVFVGFENYQTLLSDRYFWMAFRNNFSWMLGAIIFPVFFGLSLAILLSRSSMFGRVFFRTIFFLPQVLSSVTVSIIWGWIYNPSYGALNTLLSSLGLDTLRQGWLASKTFALPALFVAWSWVHYGFCMVIFIAALDSIDEVFFDAAKIDGANRWQQFIYVLLPFIRGPLTTVILVTAISAFQVFDIVFVLTKGGPAYTTLVIPMYMILNAVNYSKVGYGATIAIALGLLVFTFSLIFLRVRKTFGDQA
jgi:raffinose/stachyose/melibiose transport system permease protein